MAHKIALLNIVTVKELDPILAIFINTRFEAFFARFCEDSGLDLEQAADKARRILEDAEIPQGQL